MDDIITVSDLAGAPLHMRWMRGDEMLGGHLAGMFEYHMELESPVDTIKAKDVLGQKLTINLLLPDDAGIRYFNGHVTSWSYRGKRHDNAIYRATVQPWIWFLNFTTDCRIFNQKSAIDIVKLIFKKYHPALFDEANLTSYPTHEFLVQYRESDLNLVCRLLQEEGVYFFFKHDSAQHTLMLADGISGHEESPTCKVVPYIPPTSNARELRSHFETWKSSQDIQLQTYSVHDYDYEKARTDLLTLSNTDSKQERVSMGEIFDYPGRYRKQSQGEAIAALRLDGHHEASQSIVATGNPWGLGVGHIVTVPNPPESDDPIKYLVTSAHYELRMPEERSGGAGGDEPPYTATYSLLPTTEQFRPQRVNVKPAIVGPQTAIVVGENKNADPDPEEIVTDSFGRVRVRFHWERVGPRHPESRGKDDIEDEDNTCWIRVAQLWAGSRWGAQFLPRVGQEVVVEFLEGDPDRPLITGSVYNNVNMPPYKLTDHKTQSGIKSRSTKGGTENNFNEIRFEDLKGKEELHMQAELDMSTNVKRNQTLYVGGDQNVTIHGNQIVSVHGTDEKTGKKLPVQSVTTVTGKHTFDASDTIKIQAPTSITLECGGSTIVLTPGSITLTSGGKSTVVLDTEVFTKARGGANTKHNADVLHKSNAGAQIKLDTNVLAKSVPGAQLQLDDKVGAKSVPGSELTLDGNATLSGKGTATVQAPGGVTVSGGGGTVKADPSGVTASGTKVSVSGAGMVNIAGGIVKIN